MTEYNWPQCSGFKKEDFTFYTSTLPKEPVRPRSRRTLLRELREFGPGEVILSEEELGKISAEAKKEGK